MNEGMPTYILRQMVVRKAGPKVEEHQQTLEDSARQNQCLRPGEQAHPRVESQMGQELRCRAERQVDVGHCQQEKHQAGFLDWSAQVDILQQQADYR